MASAFQFLRISTSGDHVIATPREGLTKRQSNSGAAAGDENRVACQGHRSLLNAGSLK
jgi:hypothetical protein